MKIGGMLTFHMYGIWSCSSSTYGFVVDSLSWVGFVSKYCNMLVVVKDDGPSVTVTKQQCCKQKTAECVHMYCWLTTWLV